MNLLGIGNLLFQLGDFAVKAIISFANTDEGEKEWEDVVSAFVALDLFNPSDAEQGVSVSKADEANKPITLQDLERWNNPTSLEHSRQGREAKPARVIHPNKPTVSEEEIPF